MNTIINLCVKLLNNTSGEREKLCSAFETTHKRVTRSLIRGSVVLTSVAKMVQCNLKPVSVCAVH